MQNLNTQTISDLEAELAAQQKRLTRLRQPRTIRVCLGKIEALEAALTRRMAMYNTCLGLTQADVDALRLDPKKPINIVSRGN